MKEELASECGPQPCKGSREAKRCCMFSSDLDYTAWC